MLKLGKKDDPHPPSNCMRFSYLNTNKKMVILVGPKYLLLIFLEL